MNDAALITCYRSAILEVRSFILYQSALTENCLPFLSLPDFLGLGVGQYSSRDAHMWHK